MRYYSMHFAVLKDFFYKVVLCKGDECDCYVNFYRLINCRFVVKITGLIIWQKPFDIQGRCIFALAIL